MHDGRILRQRALSALRTRDSRDDVGTPESYAPSAAGVLVRAESVAGLTRIASVPAVLYRPPVDRRGCAAPRGRACVRASVPDWLLLRAVHRFQTLSPVVAETAAAPRCPPRGGTHAEESSVSMAAASLVFYQGRSRGRHVTQFPQLFAPWCARPVAGPHGATHDDSSAPARRALAGGVRAGGKTEMPSANCCRTCGRRRIAPRRPDPIESPSMRCGEKDAQSHA